MWCGWWMAHPLRRQAVADGVVRLRDLLLSPVPVWCAKAHPMKLGRAW